MPTRTGREPTAVCAGKKFSETTDAEKAALTGLQRGDVLARASDRNGAIREYSLALLQNPSTDPRVQLYQARGEAYLNKGWLMGSFFAAIVHHAVKDFSCVITLRPGETNGYLWRARALVAGFFHTRAIPDFDKAVQIAGTLDGSVGGGGVLAAAVLRERGMLHERLQNRSQALADYCQSLRRAPNDAPTSQKCLILAKICIARREWDAGIGALQQLQQIEGERTAEVRTLLFEALLRQAAAASVQN